ncbi:uncharacterized protein RCH25_044182 [Pelodytes ibericus]
MAEEEIRDPGMVTFNDVAVYFSLRQWKQLSDWQRQLYRNVMREIHATLTALGYEIANPGILVKVQHSEEPYYSCNDEAMAAKEEEDDVMSGVCGSPLLMKGEKDSEPGIPSVTPDILLRVKMETASDDHSCQTSEPKLEEVEDDDDSSSAVFNPELSLWIKQEEETPAGDDGSPVKDDLSVDSTPPVPVCAGRMNSSTTGTSSRSSRPRLTAHKRTGLKLRDKILVLCAYENNESVGSLATQFGVSRSQIIQIIRRRDELISALQNNVSGDRIRRRRRTTNDQVNAAVWEWLLSTQDSAITLSGRIIREKALQIASELGIQDFKASNGWLNSFKKTHNIHCYSLPFGSPVFGEDKMEEWLSQMNTMDDGVRS